MIRFSAWLAVAFGASLAVLEAVRNWGDWQWWPMWVVDYIAAALLLIGGFRALRSRGGEVAWLTAGWGFTCAMFWMSFFGHYRGGYGSRRRGLGARAAADNDHRRDVRHHHRRAGQQPLATAGRVIRALLIAAALPLAACATPAAQAPADAFMANLQGLCGKSFAGRVVTTDPADEAFAGAELVMQVHDCSAGAVRIPFRVGEDRSRTWVLTRTAEGMRLKHDHRHVDGSEDILSQYGGDTASTGSATRQEFPADAFSKALFETHGNPASVTNVWAVEVEPGRIFAYELRRANRHFRVEFDLSRPTPAS